MPTPRALQPDAEVDDDVVSAAAIERSRQRLAAALQLLEERHAKFVTCKTRREGVATAVGDLTSYLASLLPEARAINCS